MPRDIGTGLYHYPEGTPGNPGQTVFSARYNTFINDLSNTLNQKLPINMGGTGADDAVEARDNIDAEVSRQLVTNYDTHVWEAGSFYSNPGATGEPVAGKYTSGICHAVSASAMVLEAAVYDGSTFALAGKYIRVKWASWGPWTKEADDYVNTTGDTMTGPLIVTPKGSTFGSATGTAATGALAPTDANIKLYDIGSGNWSGIGADGTGAMWFRTGLSGAASAAFHLDTARNAAFAGNVVVAGTVTGAILNAAGNVTAGGTVTIGSATEGTVLFSTSGTRSLTFNGTSFSLVGGPLVVANAINSTFIPAGGTASVTGATLKVAVVPGNAGIVTRGSGDGFWHHAFENAAGTVVGNITVDVAATVYNTVSDGRLKEDLKSFNAGNIIDDTNVYDFAWKSTGERSYGIVAQQAATVYPAAVTYTEDQDWWGVDYSKYVPVLLQELKALRARVAELEGKAGVGVQPA